MILRRNLPTTALLTASLLIAFSSPSEARPATTQAVDAPTVTLFSLFGSRDRADDKELEPLAPSSSTRRTSANVASPTVDTTSRTARSSRTPYRYDARLIRAANIAENKARSSSTNRCWRYVKRALLEAEVVDSYPGTTYAKQAFYELPNNHGFKRIAVTDPYKAPVGAVLVYGGRGAGHVEFRTENGFVSDFVSEKPSPRPLIGVFVKPAEQIARDTRTRTRTPGRG